MSRPSQPIDPIIQPWNHWSQTQAPGPSKRYAPESLAQLVHIAKNAAAGRRVKASGTRWSSSAAAKATDAWVDMSALNQIIEADLAALCDEIWAGGQAERLVLVEAGIKVHALATALWDGAPSLSLPTLGGSMGQSVAGAISTGTHGCDIDLPPLSGMVRAIHLVGPGGDEYWLEHPDRPLASVAALAEHYPHWHPSIKRRRDAEAFAAALVGVGRCGFIYAYVLEAVPAFQLLEQRGHSTWSAVRQHLRQAALSGDWRAFIKTHDLPFQENATVRSRDTPAPVVANGRLSLAWVGTKAPGLFRWTHRTPDNTWTHKHIVDDGRMRRSNHAPAVAFFAGRYYLAWTGTNPMNRFVHIIRSTDETGRTWGDHQRFDGTGPGFPRAKSRVAPTLLAANGKLHLVWVGTNTPGRMRWLTSTDGASWGDKRILTDPARVRETLHRPALAFFGGRYCLAWTGTNPAHPYVHLIRSTDDTGSAWGGHVRLDGAHPTTPQAMSSGGPTLLAANGKLHLVWVGRNAPGKMRWLTTTTGTAWGDKRILADAGQDRLTSVPPALAFDAGQYHLFWTDSGPERRVHTLRSVDDGATWSGHREMRVAPGPEVEMARIRSLEVAVNPTGAYGQAWLIARTPVPLDAASTPSGGLTYAEQAQIFDALAIALQPGLAAGAGAAIGAVTDLALGGPFGLGLLQILGGLTAGAVADSRDIFVALTDLIFGFERNQGDAVGPSFQISSGSMTGYASYDAKYAEFWRLSPKVDFTEIFFDAEREDYLNFVDEVQEFFRRLPSKHGGYISLRFMGPSSAPLGMARWPISVAVEVVLFQDIAPDTLQAIEAINAIARRYDVRFHWGMTRPSDHRPAGVSTELARWRAGAARLGVEAGDGFSSAFSRANELEPAPRRLDQLLFWGGLTAS